MGLADFPPLGIFSAVKVFVGIGRVEFLYQEEEEEEEEEEEWAGKPLMLFALRLWILPIDFRGVLWLGCRAAANAEVVCGWCIRSGAQKCRGATPRCLVLSAVLTGAAANVGALIAFRCRVLSTELWAE
ncbi:hypothetical protein E2C01_064588 [Portunus trituberculatus]|uniref:Uncharacterized protein n=1 Tax=Portunus trituberculatus TaxID=210409 RepID=A0A5B7HJJ2_PORTR|nr:hypothetical protein [Portunus trituberculatus]